MSEKLYRVITSISLVVIALAVCTGTYCIYAGQNQIQSQAIPAQVANIAPTASSDAESSLSEIALALKQLEFGIRVHGIRVDRP